MANNTPVMLWLTDNRGLPRLGNSTCFEFLGFMSREGNKAQRDEGELLELLASGKAYPYLGARFGLDDVVAALRHVADGRAVGKVVIDV